MSVRVLRMRRRGVRLPYDRPDSDWIEGWLSMGGLPARVEYHRRVELRRKSDPPIAPPVMVLWEPILAATASQRILLRGIERHGKADDEGMAVVQEWLVDFDPPRTEDGPLLGEM